MLDSNNAERPSGSSYAQHRDMPYHDIQVVKALLNGNVNQEPVESLDQKSTGLTILAFLPLAKAFIQAIKDRDAEARVSREGAWEKRAFAHITIDTAEIGLSKLRKMFANFKSAGETLYVCIVPGREPLVIYMATKWLDFLIDTKTERWILEKNDQSQQANFVCFVLSSADTFMAMMARAGEQFEFHRAVKAKDLSGVSKEMMQDAMDFAEDALRDAKKWVKRGVACDVKPSFAPVMSKKAKGGATPARNQGGPPAAPARGGGQAAAPAAPPCWGHQLGQSSGLTATTQWGVQVRGRDRGKQEEGRLDCTPKVPVCPGQWASEDLLRPARDQGQGLQGQGLQPSPLGAPQVGRGAQEEADRARGGESGPGLVQQVLHSLPTCQQSALAGR